MIQAAIEQLSDGQSLGLQQMSDVMDSIMRGECDQATIVRVLALLHKKGESVEELAGAAQSLQRHMTPIACQRQPVIDTCGTGGSGKGTFNISTAAAIVAAAAGAVVAKHGNRGITSRSGSADALTALGVKVDPPLHVVQRCLQELGICFCFAPLFHSSVRHAAQARKMLPHPTIFNLLGPLCNPAQTKFQLLGAGRGETQLMLAQALALLGTYRSAVVHGEDGLGEITTGGSTRVYLVQEQEVAQRRWEPEDFGVPRSGIEELTVNSPEESAEMIRSVLQGDGGPARQIVVCNAAAALWLVELENDLASAAERCRQAIDSGAALHLLQRLVDSSHGA